jgi:hypothetical protein
VLREDDVDVDSLSGYRHVLLPSVRVLTDRQADALRAYLDRGGRVTAVGNLAPQVADLLSHPGIRTAASASEALKGHPSQVALDGPGNYGVNLHRTATGVAMHLISYDYDETAGRTRTSEQVTVKVTLPQAVTTVRIHVPGHDTYDTSVTTIDSTHTFALESLATYTVAELL